MRAYARDSWNRYREEHIAKYHAEKVLMTDEEKHAARVTGQAKMAPEVKAKKLAALSRAKLAEWAALTPEERSRRLAPAHETTAYTSIERMIAVALDARSIDYIQQYGIMGVTVDFFLPSFHLVIECDGTYWHGLPGRRAYDQARDNRLMCAGYMIVRLDEPDIRSDPDTCVEYALRLREQ